MHLRLMLELPRLLLLNCTLHLCELDEQILETLLLLIRSDERLI